MYIFNNIKISNITGGSKATVCDVVPFSLASSAGGAGKRK
jgi:hypothetical protein